MAGLACDIVTPAAKLFSNDAYMVVVPGVEGEMGFLQGHVPLVSTLADGIVRVQLEQNGEAKKFALQGGYVQVTGKKVIIEELTLAEIKENYRLHDGSSLPTLEEVLALTSERVPIIIELKAYQRNHKRLASRFLECLPLIKDK